MDGENVTSAEAESSQREGQERQRSTIGFPYIGLKEAAEMSDAIYQNVGSGGCEDDQLAAWFGSSPKSSGFRVRLAASRLFGLIETSGGHHSLTQLGLGIVDPEREAEAKVDAFLNVPLFRAIFEAWRADNFPPPPLWSEKSCPSVLRRSKRSALGKRLNAQHSMLVFANKGRTGWLGPAYRSTMIRRWIVTPAIKAAAEMMATVRGRQLLTPSFRA